ncbi:MAG: hypothetical protein A4E48_01475 [Methanosaeta sp. PtaU1.Bin060]|nr:MAG: hypothetical protein A4E48_01475 [Methanosaeta sp. PtaU1.Bin060]
MRTSILMLVAISAITGMAAAVNSASVEGSGIIFQEERNMSYQMDQKVSGDGFFSVYRYALMPDILGTEGRLYNGAEAKVKQHGSGSIDLESEFSGESTYTNTSDLYAEPEDLEIFKGARVIEELDQYDEESSAVMNVKEDGAMTYSPMAMALGSRYYAEHPLAFNSLLGEETAIKNRDGYNSMGFKVERAHAVDNLIEATTDLTDTSLKVEGDVTDGKAILKAVQYARSPLDDEDDEIPGTATKDWKLPVAIFEQGYEGTYHIKHNMTMSVSDDETDYVDAWLPCCSGGYMTMPTYYKKGSYGFGSNVKGVFDCTCFKAPAAAEWPRIYQ